MQELKADTSSQVIEDVHFTHVSVSIYFRGMEGLIAKLCRKAVNKLFSLENSSFFLYNNQVDRLQTCTSGIYLRATMYVCLEAALHGVPIERGIQLGLGGGTHQK